MAVVLYHNLSEGDMKEIRETSNAGIQFLINEEGLVKRAYKDSVGVWTIGIGSTYWETGERVKSSDGPITTERAISLFRNTLKQYEYAVYSLTRDDINHNQFDALVSLTYNIGVSAFKGSTLLKKVNANKDDKSIKAEFEKWKNAGGKPILLNRRRREAEIYFTPVKEQQATDQQIYINQVKHIQSKLGLEADGIFGKNTKTAVIEFQKKHGLEPDGVAGPQTLAELNKL